MKIIVSQPVFVPPPKTVIVTLTEAEAVSIEVALFEHYCRSAKQNDVWMPFCSALVEAKIKLNQ